MNELLDELKAYDESVKDEDEYETPRKKYYDLCLKYSILPKLDVAATNENKKCSYYFSKTLDGTGLWMKTMI